MSKRARPPPNQNCTKMAPEMHQKTRLLEAKNLMNTKKKGNRGELELLHLLEAQIVAGRLTMEQARVFLASFRESRGWRRNLGISP